MHDELDCPYGCRRYQLAESVSVAVSIPAGSSLAGVVGRGYRNFGRVQRPPNTFLPSERGGDSGFHCTRVAFCPSVHHDPPRYFSSLLRFVQPQGILHWYKPQPNDHHLRTSENRCFQKHNHSERFCTLQSLNHTG